MPYVDWRWRISKPMAFLYVRVALWWLTSNRATLIHHFYPFFYGRRHSSVKTVEMTLLILCAGVSSYGEKALAVYVHGEPPSLVERP